MDELLTAYDAIDMMESLALSISPEQRQKVKDLEQRYIKETIEPYIKNECEPLLREIESEFDLLVTYDVTCGLDIQIGSNNGGYRGGVAMLQTHSSSDGKERDRTKYSFKGSAPLTKRQCVWNVVHQYVSDHPEVTFSELEKVFPADIMRPYMSYGIVKRYDEAKENFDSEDSFRRRYFIGDDEIILLADGTRVVVSTQWGAIQFHRFLNHVRSIYPDIKPCDMRGEDDIPLR